MLSKEEMKEKIESFKKFEDGWYYPNSVKYKVDYLDKITKIADDINLWDYFDFSFHPFPSPCGEYVLFEDTSSNFSVEIYGCGKVVIFDMVGTDEEPVDFMVQIDASDVECGENSFRLIMELLRRKRQR